MIADFLNRTRPRTYERWISLYDPLTEPQRRALDLDGAGRNPGPNPLILLIMPVFRANLAGLRAAVRSVERQINPRWELCIACAPSLLDAVERELPDEARQDDRVRITSATQNGSRSAALNRVLALTHADFIALMDADAMLSDQALGWIAAEVAGHRDADLIFTDEDTIDRAGRRCNPWFKTDWNEALMLSSNGVGRLAVYRRRLVEKLGGFRDGFAGAEDYDLVLRCAGATRPERIRHIAKILYHRGANERTSSGGSPAPACAREPGRRIIEEHLNRKGLRATVRPGAVDGYQVEYLPPSPLPKVSVMVPTTGQPSLLERSLGSLLSVTTYGNLEVLVLINEKHRAMTGRSELLDRLGLDARIRVLAYPDRPFNYSWVNNWGADRAAGDILCFLNDDTEIVTADWLERLVSRVTLEGVGAAGPMMYYFDDTIQHVGLVLGIGGVATHVFCKAPRGHAGYFGRACLEQDVSCVTGACMVMRKDVFRDIGGFSEDLAVAFNDVDLCVRIRAAGWRIVWTPSVEIRHQESASFGRHDAPALVDQFVRDIAWMRHRWGRVLDADPFYNRNLSLDRAFDLAFPPR